MKAPTRGANTRNYIDARSNVTIKVPDGDVEGYAERFWSKVQRRGERDCWLWQASGKRYGKFTLPTGRRPSRQVGAHRVAYMLAVGPIPPGFVVHHVCRQPKCCNPRHLRADTQSANILRDQSPPARNASKQECIHGHPLRGDNVRIRTRRSGEVERVCVACERNRNHAAAQARRGNA